MALARWFFQLFWIGVCATAMLWQTHLLLQTPQPSLWLIIFVFSATVFGYNFTAPSKRRYPAWFLGFVALICFLNLDQSHQITVALPAVIWLLYYDPYRPGQSTGLREYPALKPLAISGAWAGVTVLLPVPVDLWTGAIPIFVGRAAFIFVLALAYDLCDRRSDLQHGLTTLVMRLGPRRTFRLIDAVLLLAAACIALQFVMGLFDVWVTVALFFSLFVTAVVIRRVVGRLGWVGWRKVVIDGLMLFQFVLVWISLKLHT